LRALQRVPHPRREDQPAFLENVLQHDLPERAHLDTRFIDETPELFMLTPRRDRATKLLPTSPT
jgi:pyruvate carboxylase